MGNLGTLVRVMAISCTAVVSACSWISSPDSTTAGIENAPKPIAQECLPAATASKPVDVKNTSGQPHAKPQVVKPVSSLPPIDLALFGEVEYAAIEPEGVRQKARIDTGAQTSSIGIETFELFERDGKTWVLFTLINQNAEEKIELKRPLKRRVRIKRHDADSVRRPVVEVNMQIGSISQDIEVTLAERSNFEYPILIGRNFLDGKAVVDVSRKFLTLDTE